METPAAAMVGLAQYVGHVVPVTYDPGQLVLSYIVSFVGAVSTLELINRRTSRKGYYNKYVCPLLFVNMISW
jgi:NO-binding membrane sensor protein with MHYT domain